MRILHLTDLHVTDPGQDLETLWVGPRELLESSSFDAIIVSGDLTQRAAPQEYEALLRFAKANLLPLLKSEYRDPTSIVFVPGNHDVNWKHDIGGKGISHTRWKRDWKELQQEPEQSNKRIDLGGILPRSFTIDPRSDTYRARLSHCQRFIDTFYTRSSALPFRRLNANELGGDWSAHHFKDHQVAIFGFNSCHRNDQFWTGAQIDPQSITSAAKYRRENCPNYTAVAVWHHGLAVEQGRPDFLPLASLARLQEAGFRIGFHGHVHAATASVLKLLQHDFVIVATGSLGAGSKDRPQSVGQQFSVVDLYPSRVVIDVYERRPPGHQYLRSAELSSRIQLRTAKQARAASPVRTESHLRTWEVDELGVARGTVILKGVSGGGPLVLGQLSPPYCAYRSDAEALADGHPKRVITEVQPDGRPRFSIVDIGDSCGELRWSYEVSNGISLDQSESEILDPVQRFFPNVRSGWDVRSHTVRHDTDKLVLTLEFSAVADGETPQAAVGEVEPLVEYVSGNEHWSVDRNEQHRCQVKIIPGSEDRRVELYVDAPIVGHRYGFMFKPKLEGPRTDPSSSHLCDALLDQCRNVRNSPTGDQITQALGLALASHLRDLLGSQPLAVTQDGAWMGLLWDSRRRRLLPTFGHFAPEAWGKRFAAGNGIAGHTFRRNAVTTSSQQQGLGGLLYQEFVEPDDNIRTALTKPGRYNWIVCVPIRAAAPFARPIGVVSFAGKSNSTALAQVLEGLAYDLSTNPRSESARKTATQIDTAVNFAFWTVVRTLKDLPQRDRSLARKFFQAYG